MGDAFAVKYVVKAHIRVVQVRKNIIRRLPQLARRRKQRFALRREHMGALAQDTVDQQAVLRKRGLLPEKAFQRFVRDGKDLRR